MMKHIFFPSALLLACAVTEVAMADCTNNRVAGTGNMNNALAKLLKGNTICVPAVGGGWDSQEEHMPNGNLIDYKLGPEHPTDPSSVIGTWSTSNGADAQVTYNYGSGTQFIYQVYRASGDLGADGSTYDFCSGNNVTSGRLKLGTGAGC